MANDAGVRYGAFPIFANDSPPKLLYFTANTAVNIFRGQFVVLNNSGQVQVVANGVSSSTLALGVAWEFLDTTMSGLPTAITTTSAGAFLPSGNNAVVGVTWDPHQLYVMEEITGGTAIIAQSAGLGAGWTYTATTGNTNTGFATTVLNNVGLTADTSNLLQILAPLNILNQDGTVNAPGASCKWVVRIQRHQLANTVFPIPQALTVP